MAGGTDPCCEPAKQPVLDLQHLERYTSGDVELRGVLLSLFSDQLSQQLAALKAGCEGDDWVLATHTLKGAARAVGAFAIGNTAELLEQLNPNLDRAKCLELIGTLEQQALACTSRIEELANAA